MEIDPRTATVRPSLNNASTPPATPDASTPPATIDASILPAAADASIQPTTPDASIQPGTADASIPSVTLPAASAPTLPAIATRSTPAANTPSTTLPAASAPTLPAIATRSTPAANTAPTAQDTYRLHAQGGSWADATIHFVAVRTKHELAIHTNYVFLGLLVFLAVSAVVAGDAVYLDKVWGLLYLWFGAVIGWVLRDAKDPKRHDSD